MNHFFITKLHAQTEVILEFYIWNTDSLSKKDKSILGLNFFRRTL